MRLCNKMISTLLTFCYVLSLAAFVSTTSNWKSNIQQQPLPDRGSMNAVEIHFDRESIQPHIEKIDFAVNLPMASAVGEDFICLPKKRTETKSKPPTSALALEENGDTEQVSVPVKTEEEIEKEKLLLINDLRDNCFQKRVGYWTYRVCPFSKVEQIHLEGNKAVQTFSLGNFVESESNSSVQVFTDGTDGRNTVVKFACVEGAHTVVSMVSEEKVHSYSILLHTNLVCDTSGEVQIRKLLSPLEGHCLQRVDGWWTYELCYKKYVRQFHRGKNSKEVSEYKLGYFDQYENDKLEKEGGALTKTTPEGKPVYTEWYTKGTECDLTGSHRSTKVVYMCPSSTTGFVELIKVEESATCGYVFSVMVPALCAHPFFEEVNQRSSSLPLNTIYCIPEDVYQEIVAAK
mmetsp:Transcript_11725/g.14615  ORF Transcript_11725/g.14615 Transcript_11725/m.14615 type:complete len:403 (-) Transcript_11725:1306-2514(-)